MPLPRFVADELAQLATANVAADRLVFQSPEGLPVRASLFRQRFWAPRAVEVADLSPLRIHDLRHTAVALWIADPREPEADRRHGGPHVGICQVLDRYGHLSQQDDELMDRLERRITGGRLSERSVRSSPIARAWIAVRPHTSETQDFEAHHRRYAG